MFRYCWQQVQQAMVAFAKVSLLHLCYLSLQPLPGLRPFQRLGHKSILHRLGPVSDRCDTRALLKMHLAEGLQPSDKGPRTTEWHKLHAALLTSCVHVCIIQCCCLPMIALCYGQVRGFIVPVLAACDTLAATRNGMRASCL